MTALDISWAEAQKGVSEGRFTLGVEGEQVPGIIWRPEGVDPRPSGSAETDGGVARPLVLIGHGGTEHKRTPYVLALARRLVRHLGYSAVAIDAPGHGERIVDEAAARQARETLQARIAGGPGGADSSGTEISVEQSRQWAERTRRAVAEWHSVLDVLVSDGLADERVGYWGLSMGTAIGLSYVASDSRVKAAVLGLAGLSDRNPAADDAARSLTIPIHFVFQWDDELMSRQSGLDLFDAFSSPEKTMHIHPGGHVQVPGYEYLTWESFFRRHLGE